MHKTRHIQVRMSQRAIQQSLVDLTVKFGSEGHDGKIVLNRKGLVGLLEEIASLKQIAQKALDKGGLVVVEEGGVLITTYRLDSYNPARISGSAERRAA